MKMKFKTISILTLLILLTLSACQGSESTIAEQDQIGSDSEAEAAEEKIYTNPHDIKIILDELERIRHEQWQSDSGWWHEQMTIQAQSGNFYGINREWWFQYGDASPCPIVLQIISQEDGQILETSLLIDENSIAAMPESQYISEREQKVKLVQLTDQSCPSLMEISLTQTRQMLDSSTLRSVQASIQDGLLTITYSQEDNPYYQEITLQLDTITGFLLYEKNQIYTHEQTVLEGEIEYSYTYQYYDELPAEIQTQLNEGLMELR